MQDCVNLAANLDGYLPWCRKGGMKDIQVLLLVLPSSLLSSLEWCDTTIYEP